MMKKTPQCGVLQATPLGEQPALPPSGGLAKIDEKTCVVAASLARAWPANLASPDFFHCFQQFFFMISSFLFEEQKMTTSVFIHDRGSSQGNALLAAACDTCPSRKMLAVGHNVLKLLMPTYLACRDCRTGTSQHDAKKYKMWDSLFHKEKGPSACVTMYLVPRKVASRRAPVKTIFEFPLPYYAFLLNVTSPQYVCLSISYFYGTCTSRHRPG